MGCCAQQVGLVLVPPEELSVGACCEQKHQTWWNPKVTNIVHSSSGVLVQLTDDAVATIMKNYDGDPLWVYFTGARS